MELGFLASLEERRPDLGRVHDVESDEAATARGWLHGEAVSLSNGGDAKVRPSLWKW